MLRISYQLFLSSNKTSQVFKKLYSCTISLKIQIRKLILPNRLKVPKQTKCVMSVPLLCCTYEFWVVLQICQTYIKNILTYRSVSINQDTFQNKFVRYFQERDLKVDGTQYLTFLQHAKSRNFHQHSPFLDRKISQSPHKQMYLVKVMDLPVRNLDIHS